LKSTTDPLIWDHLLDEIPDDLLWAEHLRMKSL
jgi:hypothetical protein